MSSESKPCRVKVPASTSNLGSGFDTLAWLCSSIQPLRWIGRQISEIRIDSCAHPDLAKTVSEAVEICLGLDNKTFWFEDRCFERVPIARGLGYSATVRVGILAGLNELDQAGLTRDQLLNLATNSKAIQTTPLVSFGGFTVF